MELAHTPNFIACIKLYVPVGARYQVLKRLFEYFLRVGCDRCQFVSLEVVLICRALHSNLQLCQILFGSVGTSDITSQFRVDTTRVHLRIR